MLYSPAVERSWRLSLNFSLKSIPRFTLFLALAGVSSLWAHHSPSAVFDMTKRVTLTGTLTKVDWINPHIVMFLDAKGKDGSIEPWKLESNPPSWFRRVGVARSDFAASIGKTVTVEGVRAKDGSAYGYMQKIILADGTSMELANGSEAK
jgi:hypothetical protein